ncbi:MarR family winged helix-turn-helix transcriptional regulator [Marisediminicola senii]|uniref:MarR family winged helix-turn-helix transcriptional regulator n=1 Tax=Marisediminicola senii TaxID=2711233 RepID=UPI0013ED8B41|nr:MarR family winged helix-turn-helix transcriptional regulator [Marisediminicola senii]
MAKPENMTVEELDAVLTWSVVRVARYAGQRLADRLAAHDLTPIHFGALAHLAAVGEMSQADLARSVLVRPQSITTLLDGLEERGLIQRTGDRTRGRRNPVRISADGILALDEIRPIAQSANDLTAEGLTLEESAELNRLLLKIIHTADGAHPKPTDELWRV